MAWHTVPVVKNSGRHSAVSCIRRKNRRAWNASINLSKSCDCGKGSCWPTQVRAGKGTLPGKRDANDSKNRGMQECFREHPDVYDDQLANPEPPEDDDDPALAEAVDATVEGIAGDAPVSTLPTSASALAQPSESSTSPSQPESTIRIPQLDTSVDDGAAQTGRAKDATEQVKRDHETGGEEQLVPKEWHDTRQKNDVQ